MNCADCKHPDTSHQWYDDPDAGPTCQFRVGFDANGNEVLCGCKAFVGTED